MGDAAAGIAVANSTKGLLPSSLTVTYLTRRGGGAAPYFLASAVLSSCSTVAQERRSLYWLDVVSCFNGCRAKKARNGRGPRKSHTMSRLAAKWL